MNELSPSTVQLSLHREAFSSPSKCKLVFQWMMAVIHSSQKCGSADPCAHITAGLPACGHKGSQERGNVQHLSCIQQLHTSMWQKKKKHSDICLREADIFVQIFSWGGAEDLWWGRLGRGGGGGGGGGWGGTEWLRVWYGVQWWRREYTADAFSFSLFFLAAPCFFPEAHGKASR